MGTDHLLDIVNERDEVVGRTAKSEARAKGLITRVAFIVIVNRKGELLIQQRKGSKDAYPLYWSGAAAGHLMSGESYGDGARRELREELGIETPLVPLGKFFSEDDREMVAVFLGIHDGPYEVAAAEIEKVALFRLDDLRHASRGDMRFTTYLESALPMVEDYARTVSP
jgi:isopentenyl-diphosphate delta-isomerase